MCDCTGSCSCSSISLPIGPKGDTGLTGPAGTAGTNGTNGIYGGFSGDWLFDTSTSTGPGSTLLRFNNSTYASVFRIYVSDTSVGTIDFDAFLDSLSNGNEFGLIRIFKKSDSTKFWMGKITAVTDNGTDHTLDVTYISSNGTFVASDPVVLTFSPSGAGIKWDTIPFFDAGNLAYKSVTGVTSNVVLATFVYPGTNNVSAISKVLANVWTSNAGNTPLVSIYDATNSLLIASSTAGTSTSVNQIIDLGTISNLPATPAVIQVRLSASGSFDSRLAAIMIGSY